MLNIKVKAFIIKFFRTNLVFTYDDWSVPIFATVSEPGPKQGTLGSLPKTPCTTKRPPITSNSFIKWQCEQMAALFGHK